jgi:hypothetical protein
MNMRASLEGTMKSGLSLTLMICFVGSALQVTAQDLESFDLRGSGAAQATVGPLSRAAAREAVRLVAAGEPPPPGLKTVEQGDESNWSRVRTLVPGTEIIVTVHGSLPRGRYVIEVGESDLTVLNVTDPTLPRAVTRVLQNLASKHPEYLTRTPMAGQFVDQAVRVGSDGVFVADQKVADLQHVVETNAREEIAEIKIRRKGQGVWGHLGLLGGYFVGAMTGGYVAGFACQAAGCDTGAFLSGMLVGGIAGGVHGFRASNRETEDVVYRAP